ncbi:hypothetical protein ElyMa_006271900 [Elysia marginata]|uniref:Uncharacterized protein n=1 Tax=Elysia marginata TaxID=1093978 RepID=A0AAV4HCQ5_9GAST|nr:hypothetical protein ElyMa_006271900 [Elysia marginata]
MTNVEGYKATVKFNAQDESLKRNEVSYLPSEQTSLSFEDNGETVNTVKIEPFDDTGLKRGAELYCVR